ncbi:hypothetical protein BU23DRAFT_523940 [Bimuria novae-zelandiae CBS 107.79]|uniref:Uncharacterized protein n=1 Tax=Bimuria novae-zelandiae CBS 107.79 TaxID=1447943 RepID=A0A6A5W1L0_9PLEO|nr:hypothetical protein BU23DRAFT_523940 [Bimuria novae-zelandiae CBS 107.79]
MRILLTFLVVFIAAVAAFPELHLLEARKDKNGTSDEGDSVKKECRKMNKMMQLMELAANQTKLDALVAKGKLNETEVQSIKNQAANTTATLQALQANTTLVDECNVFNANRAVNAQCKTMKHLGKVIAFAKNQTAVDALAEKKGLNSTQVMKFKEQITKAETKLQEMQANTTLTDLCAQQKQQKGEDNSNGATGGSGSGAGAAVGSSPARQTTSSASTLALRTLPHVTVSILAGVFAVFL